MSLWFTISVAVGFVAVFVTVITRRGSSVTSLHIDH
jgi:hypothetical protein